MKSVDRPIPEASLAWLPKSIWGPMKWQELHCRGLMHEKDMTGESEWFKLFVESIPCPKCQLHFESYIQQFPPVFTTRQLFFKWTVDAHNFVNRALKKSELSLFDAVVLHAKMLID
jgi:hypothetical protein